MSGVFIGRRDSVGVGIEATAGTAIAPQIWVRQLKLALDPKTTVAKNTSALGRVEQQNDSAVTEEWAEGSVNGKVCDISIGYFLANIFGTNNATAHAGESVVYDNTFQVNSTNTPPSLTFGRSNPNFAGRYALGTLSDFQLDAKVGDWVQFTSTLMAKIRASASDTVAYVAEHEFTSKHVTVKIASAVSGLSAATALSLKSVQLKISRKSDRFTPLGAIDPVAFDPNAWTASGQFVLRFSDTTLEALGNANTRQAMSIAMIDTDDTIGSTSNPSLTFTAPKVRLAPITLDDNLDQPLNQTINFTCELDTVAGYEMQAVLTNTQNGYAHA